MSSEKRYNNIENQIENQNKFQNSEISAIQRELEQIQILNLNEQLTQEQQKTDKKSGRISELNSSIEKSMFQSSIGVRTRAWEKEIESRISQLESSIQEKLEVEDLETFKNVIQANGVKQSEKIQEVSQHILNSEIKCKKNQESTNMQIQKFESRIQDFESNFRNIELVLANVRQSGQQMGQFDTGISTQVISDIEKKLTAKITNSIEKLGVLMKKQAGIQKLLNDKIIILEKEFKSFEARSISPIQPKVFASYNQSPNQKVRREKTYQDQVQDQFKKKQIKSKSVKKINQSNNTRETPSPLQTATTTQNKDISGYTQTIDKSLKEIEDLEYLIPKMPEYSPNFRYAQGKLSAHSDLDIKLEKPKKIKRKSSKRSKTIDTQIPPRAATTSRSLSRTPRKQQKGQTVHTTKPLSVQHKKKYHQQFEIIDKRSQDKNKKKKQKVIQSGQQRTRIPNAEINEQKQSLNDRRQRLEAIYQELASV